MSDFTGSHQFNLNRHLLGSRGGGASQKETLWANREALKCQTMAQAQSAQTSDLFRDDNFCRNAARWTKPFLCSDKSRLSRNVRHLRSFTQCTEPLGQIPRSRYFASLAKE